MKNKILYTEITTIIDDLAKALRKYSGESVIFTVDVMTRDSDVDDEAPDFYQFRINRDRTLELIKSEGGWIYRDADDKIIKVKRIGENDGGAS